MSESRLMQVLKLVKTRRQRRWRQRRAISNRIAKISLFLLGLLSTGAAILALGVPALFATITRDLPSVEALPELLDPEVGRLLQPTLLYDRNGQLLMTLAPPGFETRSFVQAGDNANLDMAFVAAFDPDFYRHGGFTLSSLSNDPSTLAEILASELLLADEENGALKNLRGRLLAAQATQNYGREQILTWALNSSHFGNFVYGAGDAANFYFGKSVQELSLAEAVLLAASAKDPANNPVDALEIAMKNQRENLLSLLEQGVVSEGQVQVALIEKIAILTRDTEPISPAPDFGELALQELISRLGEARVGRGGMQVITTLDLPLQMEAETKLAGREAEIIILESVNGKIIAMLGSAQDASHSPGTILSPFVYLSAFANGYAPASLIWDIPANVMTDLPDYANADGRFHGPINLRQALAKNYLVPTIHLLSQVGPQRSWQITREAGLRSLNTGAELSSLEILIDGGQVSLLEIAQAYGSLANQGVLAGQYQADAIHPSALLIVRGAQGNILLEHTEAETRSISAPELAYLVTDILSDASTLLESEKSALLAGLDRPAALQTASSPDGAERWAVGYSPQLVVAAWSSGDAQGGEGFSSARLAELWSELFTASHKDRDIESWLAPQNLSSVVVCVPSGMLPSADCPETRREFFLAGFGPTRVDTLYQRLSVNRYSGKLATVFTALEFIEERVFLNLPSEAEEWARQAGIPLAPSDFDVIAQINPQSDTAMLLSPAAFSSVRGQIRIRGTAAGKEFASYRVLIGKGLYPSQWIEIARSPKPVNNAQLAVWDAQGVAGPFTIQLQVILQDASIQSAFSLISTDYLAPHLEIINPQPNQELRASEMQDFAFRVQAEDNFSLAAVRFYLDGKLFGTLREAPYELSWHASFGEHRLRVMAVDLAGNISLEEINFNVLP